MKATGIVRKMDGLGRVVIPMELRRTMRIQEKDPIEIFTNENGEIVLRKYQPGCRFCSSSENLVGFANEHICQKCVDILSGQQPARKSIWEENRYE